MNRSILAFVLSAATLLAADKAAPEKAPPTPEEVRHARVLFVHEGDIAHLYCRMKQDCAVQAPDGEKFVSRTIGDATFWNDSADTLPSRLYTISPSFDGQKTTLHLITDHDNIYAFVMEATSKSDADITTILKSDDPAVKKRIAEVPTVVSYAEFKAKTAADEALIETLQQTLTQQQNEAANQKGQVAAATKKDMLAQLHSYEFDRSEAQKYPWQVSEIRTDGQALYITRSTAAGDLPSVVTVGANGKPEISVPQYDPATGLYVVMRPIHDGYLSFGAQKKEKKLQFHLAAS